jgi:hypothetical protein
VSIPLRDRRDTSKGSGSVDKRISNSPVKS